MSEKRVIFAIFGAIDNAALDKLISEKFTKDERYKISSGQWLIVAGDSMPSMVYEYIAGDLEKEFTCIITPVYLCYGWHDAAIWEWIDAKRKC